MISDIGICFIDQTISISLEILRGTRVLTTRLIKHTMQILVNTVNIVPLETRRIETLYKKLNGKIFFSFSVLTFQYRFIKKSKNNLQVYHLKKNTF